MLPREGRRSRRGLQLGAGGRNNRIKNAAGILPDERCGYCNERIEERAWEAGGIPMVRKTSKGLATMGKKRGWTFPLCNTLVGVSIEARCSRRKGTARAQERNGLNERMKKTRGKGGEKAAEERNYSVSEGRD